MASKRHHRNDVTLLENFPNEILLEIFSYIPCVDIANLFVLLNSRFQSLLTEYCRMFNFKLANKKNFDTSFEYLNTNQWHSLKLSDGDRTPGQVAYFFEKYKLSDNFSELRSLSIVKMDPEFSYSIFTQLPFLSNLVSLELESLYADNIPELELPNLKKLTLSSCLNTSWLMVRRPIIFIELYIKYELHLFYRICLHLKPLSIQL